MGKEPGASRSPVEALVQPIPGPFDSPFFHIFSLRRQSGTMGGVIDGRKIAHPEGPDKGQERGKDERRSMMLLLLFRLLLNALVIFAVSRMVRGVEIRGFPTAIAVSVVLGFFNILVRPVLVILTLPITILTLGLFIFVLNAFLLWLVSEIVPGFEIRTFFAALLAAFLISLGSLLVSMIFPKGWA